MTLDLWGALTIYVVTAFLLVALLHRLMWALRLRFRMWISLWLIVLLLTSGASDASITHFAPALMGVLYNLLAHSWWNLLRSLIPLTLSSAAVLAIWGWWPMDKHIPDNERD